MDSPSALCVVKLYYQSSNFLSGLAEDRFTPVPLPRSGSFSLPAMVITEMISKQATKAIPKQASPMSKRSGFCDPPVELTRPTTPAIIAITSEKLSGPLIDWLHGCFFLLFPTRNSVSTFPADFKTSCFFAPAFAPRWLIQPSFRGDDRSRQSARRLQRQWCHHQSGQRVRVHPCRR